MIFPIIIVVLMGVVILVVRLFGNQIKLWLHWNVGHRCKICDCSQFYVEDDCNCVCHKDFLEG